MYCELYDTIHQHRFLINRCTSSTLSNDKRLVIIYFLVVAQIIIRARSLHQFPYFYQHIVLTDQTCFVAQTCMYASVENYNCYVFLSMTID